MSKKYRYWLEVTWQGHTTRLWGADKRVELDEYIMKCGPGVEARVIDSLEEEASERGTHRRPRRGT